MLTLAAVADQQPAEAKAKAKPKSSGMELPSTGMSDRDIYPDMSTVASYASGDSVQVFSLDGPPGGMAPAPMPGYGMGMSGGGMDMSGMSTAPAPMMAAPSSGYMMPMQANDPAVTVFPMDGGGAYTAGTGSYYTGYMGSVPDAETYAAMNYRVEPRRYLPANARPQPASLEERKLLLKLPDWMKPIPRGYSR